MGWEELEKGLEKREREKREKRVFVCAYVMSKMEPPERPPPLQADL